MLGSIYCLKLLWVKILYSKKGKAICYYFTLTCTLFFWLNVLKLSLWEELTWWTLMQALFILQDKVWHPATSPFADLYTIFTFKEECWELGQFAECSRCNRANSFSGWFKAHRVFWRIMMAIDGARVRGQRKPSTIGFHALDAQYWTRAATLRRDASPLVTNMQRKYDSLIRSSLSSELW